VFEIRAAPPEQYMAPVDEGAGHGLWQGEIFALALTKSTSSLDSFTLLGKSRCSETS
jgi:hypothetical protein